MRVVVHFSKFYDWVPVPANVTVTPEDIASGKVMPNKDRTGYKARVLKEPAGGTHAAYMFNEESILAKIIHEKVDVKRAGRTFSRKEAVAHFVMDHLLELDGITDWSWVTKWEIHDDGPDEALARKMLVPHTVAKHGRRPGMNLPPEHLELVIAKYLEPATPADHVQHLGQHFGTVEVSS